VRDFRFFVWERSARCAGIGGRAAVQPGNGAILAGLYRFKPDEPEHNVNLARSLFMQLKHARDKPVALRRRFRRAFGVVAFSEFRIGLSILAQVKKDKGFGGNVSRETIPVSANDSCEIILLLRQAGRRTSHSALTMSF